MKFISLQHISIEDPGTFKDFLIEDGHSITTIQLDEGDSIPNNLDELTLCFAWVGLWIHLWRINIHG